MSAQEAPRALEALMEVFPTDVGLLSRYSEQNTIKPVALLCQSLLDYRS